MGNPPAAWILLTSLLLGITKPGECKVYYNCGAVLNPSGRDLILSPVFPNNYLPGSHCLWQILVPAGSTVMLETLDFDVFDDESATSYSFFEFSSQPEYTREKKDTSAEGDLSNSPEIRSQPTVEKLGHQDGSKETRSMSGKENKTITELQELTTAQDYISQISSTPSATSGKYESLTGEINRPMQPLAAATDRMATVPYEQVSEGVPSTSFGTDPFTTTTPVPEICPLDVLYITDLVTYSVRFCGSNSPKNKSLTFGSPVEMTEVILELITITNRGRGFAILLSYHNQSLVSAMGVQERRGREGVVLLAVIAATISFALVLLLILCLTFRQKICHKREHSDGQITTQVTGIQNTALEVNELQLVMSDENLQCRELENGQGEGVADVSQQSQQEDPSSCTIAVSDSNSDEVFVISPGNHTNCPNFGSSRMRVGNLKRSVTSPASVSDWLTSDYTSVDLTGEEKGSEGEDIDSARQRAWSVRTFNSLLPHLQMKWRSRTSSGSFTKLVDSGCTATGKALSPKTPRRAGSAAQIGENRLYSESSESNASYPLTHSAHLHRNLPSGNLKRTRPYFGLLNDSSDCIRSGQAPAFGKENRNMCQMPVSEYSSSLKISSTNGIRAKELSIDFEKPNTVFVICEEADDQQPLVFDDQLSSPTECESQSSDTCRAPNCSLISKRYCTDINPWMKCTNASLGTHGCQNTHCTSTVGSPVLPAESDFQCKPVRLLTE
ncbi:hypothetical protein GDO81_002262 [Engystomops pustulosus]|uniref:CUB domain-containing protein n=1 Tax=Engystomops pustulosus TaxID=76066 RepID=A0AAV7DKA4_ENGPU|nr:hypothetical protein GDO81_002262 [Engystomops pustulosus]